MDVRCHQLNRLAGTLFLAFAASLPSTAAQRRSEHRPVGRSRPHAIGALALAMEPSPYLDNQQAQQVLPSPRAPVLLRWRAWGVGERHKGGGVNLQWRFHDVIRAAGREPAGAISQHN